jgi:hypothetical protein
MILLATFLFVDIVLWSGACRIQPGAAMATPGG